MRRGSSSGRRAKRATASAGSTQRRCKACARPLRASALPIWKRRYWEQERLKTMRARFEGEGDVIVVTGGAGGIGRALACAAAQAGARVVVCDVDEPAMASLSEVSGISTRRLDVADR